MFFFLCNMQQLLLCFLFDSSLSVFWIYLGPHVNRWPPMTAQHFSAYTISSLNETKKKDKRLYSYWVRELLLLVYVHLCHYNFVITVPFILNHVPVFYAIKYILYSLKPDLNNTEFNVSFYLPEM